MVRPASVLRGVVDLPGISGHLTLLQAGDKLLGGHRGLDKGMRVAGVLGRASLKLTDDAAWHVWMLGLNGLHPADTQSLCCAG